MTQVRFSVVVTQVTSGVVVWNTGKVISAGLNTVFGSSGSGKKMITRERGKYTYTLCSHPTG
jgi:hypothetical protein